jgi:bifunctional non-homologous end joining protein LigD
MEQENIIDRADMYLKEGRSDKVYHIQLVLDSDGYTVNYQHGRRGNALQAGAKVKNVDLPKAQKVFTTVVREKLAKGYNNIDEFQSSTLYDSSGIKESLPGRSPMLLNEVPEGYSVQELFISSDWIMSQKIDGRRVQCYIDASGTFNATNRKGQIIDVPLNIKDEMSLLMQEYLESDNNVIDAQNIKDCQILLDGELLDKHFMVFDILHYGMRDLRSITYIERMDILSSVFAQQLNAKDNSVEFSKFVCPIRTFDKGAGKAAMFKALHTAGMEGVVFRKASSTYEPGCPASAGDALKLKFYNELTAIVSVINDKHSVGLTLLDESGGEVHVGNCTIPQNTPLPEIGSLVEVRYLYAYPGGSLYQPNYEKQRDDLFRDAASMKQVKYKPVDQFSGILFPEGDASEETTESDDESFIAGPGM